MRRILDSLLSMLKGALGRVVLRYGVYGCVVLVSMFAFRVLSDFG